MELVDRRTASALATILLFIAAGAFLYGARHILIVFLLAIFFAYLLEPLVSRFELWRRVSRGSRGLAILEVYVIFCAAIAAVFVLVGPHIVSQAKNLTGALPSLFQKVSSGQIALQIGSTRGWSHNTQIYLQEFLAGHRNLVLSWVSSLGARVADFAQNAIWFLLIPILAVFFLKDGRKFAENLVEMVEQRQKRRFLTELTEDLSEMLAHYIRMQLILAGLSLAAYIGVLSAMRMP